MKTSRLSAYPVVEGESENRQSSDVETASYSTVQESKSEDRTIKPTCKYVLETYQFAVLIS